MEEKKFELTDETREGYDCTLYRIKALKYFSDVKKGELGGFVEKEDNLSQDGNCWVYNDAKVFDEAKVFGNARVYGHAQIYGNAIVYNNATVCGDVYVNDSVKVYGHAKVSDNGDLDGGLNISGDSEVRKTSDYMAFKLNLDSNEWLTWTKSNNIWQSESFYGTGDELIKRAYNDSKESGKKYEALINMVKQINDGRKEI